VIGALLLLSIAAGAPLGVLVVRMLRAASIL
jgi:hypothetical protein